MLKGAVSEVLESYMELIFVVTVFLAMIMTVTVTLITYDSSLAEATSNLDAIDLVHLVDECLSEDSYYIDARELKNIRNMDELKEKCGINREDIGVKIYDMDGESWDFSYPDLNLPGAVADASYYEHEMFVNIKNYEDETSEIHVGKIKGVVKEKTSLIRRAWGFIFNIFT